MFGWGTIVTFHQLLLGIPFCVPSPFENRGVWGGWIQAGLCITVLSCRQQKLLLANPTEEDVFQRAQR